MVTRIAYSSGKSSSFLPSIRGNSVPKLNLQFSQKELSIDEKKLFGNFRKGQIKSAPLSMKSQKTKTEITTTSLVALERKVRILERGKMFSRGTQEDARNNTTPKSKEGKRKTPLKTKDCRDYVRNYANRRILSREKENENVLLVERRERYEKKNADVEIPLKFAGDVIEERGDIQLLTYPRTNSKTLFIYKKNFNKPRGSKREIRGMTPRHPTCLPVEEDYTFVRTNPKYLYNAQSNVPKEEDEEDETINSTLIWEQHVLSLVSKTTAQFIANQCSIGRQRERLICFLDEFYDERDPEVSGAGSVRKLVDIDDDCITVPKKRIEGKTVNVIRKNCGRSY